MRGRASALQAGGPWFECRRFWKFHPGPSPSAILKDAGMTCLPMKPFCPIHATTPIVQTTFEHADVLEVCLSRTNLLQRWFKQAFLRGLNKKPVPEGFLSVQTRFAQDGELALALYETEVGRIQATGEPACTHDRVETRHLAVCVSAACDGIPIPVSS